MEGLIKMNKKQAGIIVALFALIVCAGFLSFKVSGPLYGENGTLDDKSAVSYTESTTNYFTEARLTREQSVAKACQTLQNLIDDENTPKEEKQKAAEQFRQLSVQLEQAKKLEMKLKGHGFEDAVCYIDGDKVTVFVKSTEDLTEKQTTLIKDVVMSSTNIKDVKIVAKK
jgi:stage III sporulation protein AH